jgi:hypothetical protein
MVVIALCDLDPDWVYLPADKSPDGDSVLWFLSVHVIQRASISVSLSRTEGRATLFLSLGSTTILSTAYLRDDVSDRGQRMTMSPSSARRKAAGNRREGMGSLILQDTAFFFPQLFIFFF